MQTPQKVSVLSDETVDILASTWQGNNDNLWLLNVSEDDWRVFAESVIKEADPSGRVLQKLGPIGLKDLAASTLQSMQGGPESFCIQWGWRTYARALFQTLNQPTEA